MSKHSEVSWIDDSFLSLRACSPIQLQALHPLGHRAQRTGPNGRKEADAWFVPLRFLTEPFFSWERSNEFTLDERLAELAVALRDANVAFREVPQADASPARYVRALQARGRLVGSFLEARYDYDSPREI